MKEHEIQGRIRVGLDPYGRFFRVNVGTAWTGNEIKQFKLSATVRVEPGDVLIRNARPFNTGLPPGFSDIIGVAPVEIAEEHIGKTLGIFAAIEVKSQTGRVSDDQKNFIKIIKKYGARAGVARSIEDAVAIVRGD